MAEAKKPAPGGPVTEAPNPRTRDLDRLPIAELVSRILDEDARVAVAVRETRPAIERACQALVATLEAGGRWINLGAGTSGRIGALDAAEIPPTFGLDPERVQALIAGGAPALTGAVEGAEDDVGAAVRELGKLAFGSGDALVALSASGRTPYALAGIEHARGLGARTIGITCVPDSPLATRAEIAIVAVVGPEVIAGSTRMKGGLAQKMILHTLSTAVMVKLGRVQGNLMTGLRAVNTKLQERGVRILCELAAVSPAEAERALDAAGGSVEKALSELGRR
ncbi:MAG: N-acetylmuramic acid 6-phosphate etherase [Deltaproteobacteria bacterium]|nr:N-acetylmuramic acid 6-phosphate etherase [Deltaproteobacteria bacterium]